MEAATVAHGNVVHGRLAMTLQYVHKYNIILFVIVQLFAIALLTLD